MGLTCFEGVRGAVVPGVHGLESGGAADLGWRGEDAWRMARTPVARGVKSPAGLAACKVFSAGDYPRPMRWALATPRFALIHLKERTVLVPL